MYFFRKKTPHVKIIAIMKMHAILLYNYDIIIYSFVLFYWVIFFSVISSNRKRKVQSNKKQGFITTCLVSQRNLSKLVNNQGCHPRRKQGKQTYEKKANNLNKKVEFTDYMLSQENDRFIALGPTCHESSLHFENWLLHRFYFKNYLVTYSKRTSVQRVLITDSSNI